MTPINLNIAEDKLMRYILTSILLIFFTNTHILNANVELTPLSKKVKEFNLRKPLDKLHYLAYFSLRCGSLFTSIHNVFPNKNYLNASLNLQKGALITAILIKKTNQKQIKKEVEEQIKSYVDIYANLIKSNYNLHNSYIEGSEFLSQEETTCKKFVPRAYKFLRSNNFTIKR